MMNFLNTKLGTTLTCIYQLLVQYLTLDLKFRSLITVDNKHFSATLILIILFVI
jgi:hypothetical protein